MISKCIAFLVAGLMLANCCALGIGCAPQSSAPIAWDGLGPAPTDDTQPLEPRLAKPARAKREIIVGPVDAAATEPNSKLQLKGSWEQQQAADQDDEARLTHTSGLFVLNSNFLRMDEDHRSAGEAA
jgi:hypothetical protein